jgi:hypothetical protein
VSQRSVGQPLHVGCADPGRCDPFALDRGSTPEKRGGSLSPALSSHERHTGSSRATTAVASSPSRYGLIESSTSPRIGGSMRDTGGRHIQPREQPQVRSQRQRRVSGRIILRRIILRRIILRRIILRRIILRSTNRRRRYYDLNKSVRYVIDESGD